MPIKTSQGEASGSTRKGYIVALNLLRVVNKLEKEYLSCSRKCEMGAVVLLFSRNRAYSRITLKKMLSIKSVQKRELHFVNWMLKNLQKEQINHSQIIFRNDFFFHVKRIQLFDRSPDR